MRAIICGGRKFGEYTRFVAVMDQFHAERPITLVIQGGATGADYLGKIWARARKIPCQEFIPYWSLYGNAAGPIRNRTMLVEGKPDIVIAFPGGPGTANMIKQAQKRGVEVIRVEP